MKILRQLFIMSKYLLYATFLQVLFAGMLFANKGLSQKSIHEIKLSIDFNNENAFQILKDIDTKTEFYFAYNRKDLANKGKITKSFKDDSLADILGFVSKKMGLGFKRVNNTIYVKTLEMPQQEEIIEEVISQQVTISGKVTDGESGEGLPGVSILIKGTSTGTTTDIDGAYALQATENDILQYSYIGFITQEITVGAQTTINISLKPDADQLEEVVVVGYGTEKKANLTGSVSTIDSKAVTQVPAANSSALLAGQFPGVITNQASGLAGNDDTRIRIRGFAGNPLVLVDGVQITGGLNRIDPNDIESITVLKDAAAAVYGSRAGNGVILVTTKRGEAGPPQFSYDGSVTFQEATSFLELVDAPKYVELFREADLLDVGDADATYTLEDLENFRNRAPGFEGGDWLGTFVNNFAPMQQHSLKASGGSENVKYFTSVGYTHQESYISSRDFDYRRFNARSNIDVKVDENISFLMDMSYRVDDRQAPHNYDGIGETFTQLGTAKPTLPTSFPDPSFIPHTGFLQRQPIARTNRDIGGTWDRRDETFQGRMGINYKLPFLEGLSLRAEVNVVQTQRGIKATTKPFDVYSYDFQNDTYQIIGTNGALSSISDQQFRRQQIYPLLALNFEQSFGNHSFKALALAEQITRKESFVSARRQDLLTTAIPEIFSGSENLQFTDGYSAADIGRKSFVGRLNYAFKNRYLLEVAFRADGNVLFAPETRWGYFPSVSAGWVISREPFMANSSFFDNLKIRASYSQLGDDTAQGLALNTQNGDFGFDYLAGFQQSEGIYLLGNNSAQPRITTLGLPNPFLTWEEITLYNFGIEASILDGRLTFEADAFYRNREGLLGENLRDIPSTFGADLPLVNLNSRNNRGFEIMMNYKQIIGDFEFNISPNFTFARARWGDVFDQEAFDDPDQERINSRQDQWVNRNFGYKTDGIFMSQEEIDNHPIDQDEQGNSTLRPGDIKYLDLNGDSLINFRDQDIIAFAGNTPELIYGLNLGVTYKNFGMSMLFQGASRFSLNIQGNARTMFSNFSIPLQYHYDLRWSPDPENPGVNINPNAQFPAATTSPGGNNDRNSDFWRQNVTYFRLKNINIYYNLPEKILTPIGLNSAQVYVAGFNMFTVSSLGIFKNSFDPEEGTTGNPSRNIPVTRNFTAGVRISF